MIYNYVAILFFCIVAILAPTVLLLLSRLIRKKSPANSVKSSPYESGEQSSGKSMDTDVGYLPFAMLFLPSEVVCVVVILWARTAIKATLQQNLVVMGFLALSTILAIVCYALISGIYE